MAILCQGTIYVLAVGEIIGPYEFHEEFNDVDGWALGHVRRVRWLWKGTKEFDVYTLKFGDTTQILSEDSIVRVWLKNLDISIQSQVAPLRQIPETKNIAVKYDDISSYLFGKGVASDRINNLMSQIGELVRIAKWYNDSDKNKPSKVEIINYLVVPLPRTLGWTPQLMAIEWNNIDIALFSELPRKYGFLNLVVEVKKLNAPALSAFKQAKGYALKSKKCRRVIVTDGLRYGVFTKNRKKGIFSCRIYEFDTPPQ